MCSEDIRLRPHAPDDGRSYAYLRPKTNPAIRDLLSVLTCDSLIDHPIEYREGGGDARLTLIETSADHQSVVESLLSVIDVEVGQIGEYTDYDAVTSVPSGRQRGAVETGLLLGYYDVPWQATYEDIAACIGCAKHCLGTPQRRMRSSSRL